MSRRVVRIRLLSGSMLASAILAPASALAQQAVNLPAQTAPVVVNNTADCTFAGDCIFIQTVGSPLYSIELTNSGTLVSTAANGINTETDGADISIVNTGGITAALDGILATVNSYTLTAGAGDDPLSPAVIAGDGSDGGTGGPSDTGPGVPGPNGVDGTNETGTDGDFGFTMVAAAPADVSIVNQAAITTTGDDGSAIEVDASNAILIGGAGANGQGALGGLGGNGGRGGSGSDTVPAPGGQGGNGGNGGDATGGRGAFGQAIAPDAQSLITVNNQADLTTQGTNANGIMVVASRANAIGGDAGAAGNAIGGGGGEGGSGGIAGTATTSSPAGDGGSGGYGGDGGTATAGGGGYGGGALSGSVVANVVNSATIEISGSSAYGMIFFSSGGIAVGGNASAGGNALGGDAGTAGSGGMGGDSDSGVSGNGGNGSFGGFGGNATGGRGGKGGDATSGDLVPDSESPTIVNAGTIVTTGDSSLGLVVGATSGSAVGGMASNAGSAIGGAGGAGGNAGAPGAYSPLAFAGDGGNGGTGLTGGMATSGEGNAGGDARGGQAIVFATNQGSITTSGANSAGMAGQFVGGNATGGDAGVGGLALGGFGGAGGAGSAAYNAGAALGGAGGDGGMAQGGYAAEGGSAVSYGVYAGMTNIGSIVTNGEASDGMLIYAIGGNGTGGEGANGGAAFGGTGGSGGVGGDAISQSITSLAGTLGGDGGGGGDAVGGEGLSGGFATGGTVRLSIANQGSITTTNVASSGIHVIAAAGNGIGGNGGAGGSAIGGDGGTGGSAGNGSLGSILFSGGDGGNGGAGGDGGDATGGEGGAGGTGAGGSVQFDNLLNSGSITTSGDASHGIFVELMAGTATAGNGGAGGDATGGNGGAGGTAPMTVPAPVDGPPGFGGSGGAGGNAAGGAGGAGGYAQAGQFSGLTIGNSGTINTSGVESFGILVLSEGGTTASPLGGTPGTATDGATGTTVSGTGGFAGIATAGAAGIAGTASGTSPVNVTVNNSGLIDGSGGGVGTLLNGSITVNNTGSITSTGTTLYLLASEDIDVVNSGTLGGDGSSPVILAGGASAEITNQQDGLVYGYVSLSDQGDTVINDGTWLAEGTSNFGAGTDSFTNTGFLRTTYTPVAAEAVSFTALEQFNNSGGAIALADGGVGDTFTISGNYAASGNALLAIDLSGDATGLTADRLIVGGATSGTTAVDLNILPGAAVFDPDGVLVVDAASGTGLFTGRETVGLIEYSVVMEGVDAYVVSTANASVTDFGLAGNLARDAYQTGADMALSCAASRRGRLGMSVDKPLTICAQGFWQRETSGEDRTISLFGTDYDVTGRMRTRTKGAQFDLGYQISPTLIVGVTAGAAQARVGQAGFATSMRDFTQNYGAWVEAGGASGLFGAALVNYADHDLSLFNPVAGSFSGDADSLGIDVEGGWRTPAMGAMLEVSGGLSHSRTKLTDIDTGQFVVDYDSFKSTRGRIGVRMGWPAAYGAFVDAHVHHEFAGGSDTTLSSNGNVDSFDLGGKGTWVRFEGGIGGATDSVRLTPMLSLWGQIGDRKGVGVKAGIRF